MKVLLIFDNQIHIKHLTQKLLASDIQQIDLFPLTSDWSVVKEVEQACRAARDDSNVVVLSSAKNINDAVDSSREEIIRWSAEFANYEIRGKSIIEWFLTPGKEVSTWWFSLLSEKNPYTVEQRVEMIRRVYGNSVEVIVIPDINSINIGRKVGYDVNRIDPPADIGAVSGTKVRAGECGNLSATRRKNRNIGEYCAGRGSAESLAIAQRSGRPAGKGAYGCSLRQGGEGGGGRVPSHAGQRLQGGFDTVFGEAGAGPIGARVDRVRAVLEFSGAYR